MVSSSESLRVYYEDLRSRYIRKGYSGLADIEDFDELIRAISSVERMDSMLAISSHGSVEGLDLLKDSYSTFYESRVKGIQDEYNREYDSLVEELNKLRLREVRDNSVSSSLRTNFVSLGTVEEPTVEGIVDDALKDECGDSFSDVSSRSAGSSEVSLDEDAPVWGSSDDSSGAYDVDEDVWVVSGDDDDDFDGSSDGDSDDGAFDGSSDDDEDGYVFEVDDEYGEDEDSDGSGSDDDGEDGYVFEVEDEDDGGEDSDGSDSTDDEDDYVLESEDEDDDDGDSGSADDDGEDGYVFEVEDEDDDDGGSGSADDDGEDDYVLEAEDEDDSDDGESTGGNRVSHSLDRPFVGRSLSSSTSLSSSVSSSGSRSFTSSKQPRSKVDSLFIDAVVKIDNVLSRGKGKRS